MSPEITLGTLFFLFFISLSLFFFLNEIVKIVDYFFTKNQRYVHIPQTKMVIKTSWWLAAFVGPHHLCWKFSKWLKG